MNAHCREGNHMGQGPHCTRCGQWIGDDELHMRWVKDSKVYDSETATRLHTMKFPDGKPKEALFVSPNGQYFTVTASKTGRTKGNTVSKRKAKSWLEKHSAPPEAFEDGALLRKAKIRRNWYKLCGAP